MTCHLYQDDLSAYLDRELPAARAARLEAHLRVCPRCRGELNEISGITTYIRSAVEDLRPRPGFDDRVLRAVGYYQLAGLPTRRRSLLRPLLAAGVGLLALLGAVQHFLANRPPMLPAPSPQTSQAAVGSLGSGAPFANQERR